MNYLSDYQTFENKQQLNEAVSDHLSSHTYDLNDTARDVLLMLARYAVKYPGVAHLKTATIAGTIGKTGRTIRRAITKLIEEGIIEKLPFMRTVSGGYGANIYRILPSGVQSNMSSREHTAEPCESKPETVENVNEPISSFNLNNKYILDTSISVNEIIKRGLKHAIPTPIYDALAPFFDGQTLYDTYGILLRAKASIDRSITLETHGQAYVDAFMNVVRLYKAGKVRKLNGLLYSAWQSVTATIKRRVSVDKHPVLYDWLT